MLHKCAGLTDGGAVLMDSTRLSNTFTCQPQSRNMHGRIFGGFLMRRAYELAYATVHMFAGTKPKFIQVDRVRAADGSLFTAQKTLPGPKTSQFIAIYC